MLTPAQASRQLIAVAETLRASQTVVLSTHREADGDGIGSQVALFWALKKMQKSVRILNVDEPARKYRFLNTEEHIQSLAGHHDPLATADVAVIFDTNDHRLVEPLYSQLVEKCKQIIFIDHHPPLAQGPWATSGSLIELAAASTGELTHAIIKALGVELDRQMARALYTSIVFDTQLFRYVRGSANSHLIAAELLQFEKQPEEVHRALMANHTVQKMSFLAHALANIEYLLQGRLALLKLSRQEIHQYQLDWDDSRDVVDLLMNIESLEAACLFREDAPGVYKMSLRSKGGMAVLPVAESMGGGGHLFSAGAFCQGKFEELRRRVVELLSAELEKLPNSRSQLKP